MQGGNNFRELILLQLYSYVSSETEKKQNPNHKFQALYFWTGLC